MDTNDILDSGSSHSQGDECTSYDIKHVFITVTTGYSIPHAILEAIRRRCELSWIGKISSLCYVLSG